MADNNLQSTTQEFLDIHDITNDLVIMKDGTTSLVLTVDAMNFGLLAEEEQDSIIYAYASLLNSLNYPIQVLVKSQTKDVTSYLRLLEEQEMQANTPENRQRIRRYREFVANLIHERNVLDKKFYVVIPASPLELGLLTADSVIPGRQAFDVTSVERSVLLEKAKNILEPKRDHLISQFARIGLFSRQLNTQEIIQYFYVSYNPEASEGQEIADSNSYSTPLVKASFEGLAMQQSDPTNTNLQPPLEPPAAPAELPTEPTPPAEPTPPTPPVTEITPAGLPVEPPMPAGPPVEPVLPTEPLASVAPETPAPPVAPLSTPPAAPPITPVTPPNDNLPKLEPDQTMPQIPVETNVELQKTPPGATDPNTAPELTPPEAAATTPEPAAPTAAPPTAPPQPEAQANLEPENEGEDNNTPPPIAEIQ